MLDDDDDDVEPLFAKYASFADVILSPKGTRENLKRQFITMDIMNCHIFINVSTWTSVF